jgi:hypothetical protein
MTMSCSSYLDFGSSASSAARALRLREASDVAVHPEKEQAEDISVYGTGVDFRGHTMPGASVSVDLAGEYSLTRRWVLALDATYRDQSNTRAAGYNMLNSSPIDLNSGASDAFGLAPATETNPSGQCTAAVPGQDVPNGKYPGNDFFPRRAVIYRVCPERCYRFESNQHVYAVDDLDIDPGLPPEVLIIKIVCAGV